MACSASAKIWVKTVKSLVAALTFAVNLLTIETRLATALLALICLLKIATLFTSSTVIVFASLGALYSAWALAIIAGAGLGTIGFPAGLTYDWLDLWIWAPAGSPS